MAASVNHFLCVNSGVLVCDLLVFETQGLIFDVENSGILNSRVQQESPRTETTVVPKLRSGWASGIGVGARDPINWISRVGCHKPPSPMEMESWQEEGNASS